LCCCTGPALGHPATVRFEIYALTSQSVPTHSQTAPRVASSGRPGSQTLIPPAATPHPLLSPLVASRGRRRTKPGGAGEGGGGALVPLASQRYGLEEDRLVGLRRSPAARRLAEQRWCCCAEGGGGEGAQRVQRRSWMGVAAAGACPGPDLGPAGRGRRAHDGCSVASCGCSRRWLLSLRR
jgi:hypothetical protein